MRNDRGFSLVSALVALGLIATVILGVGGSSIYLKRAMTKTEISSMAVAVESNLLDSFNNKANFTDNGDKSISDQNAKLRNGTLQTFQFKTAFASLSVPVQTPGNGGGTVGFLDKNFKPCSGFSSLDCLLSYEVRLRKTTVGNIPSYAFAYQISANPNVSEMAPLGDISSYDSPLDPGNFRVETAFTKCDPQNDLFLNGVNRDTGEAFCAEKPKVTKCPDGTLPRGIKYETYQGQKKSGAVELVCSNPMRSFNCPDNYSLQQMDPRYVDPETSYSSVPGTCVFRTAHSARLSGAYPPNPTSPYMAKVSGTFCPPYYAVAGSGGCNLVPDQSRNNSLAFGKGRCAPIKYKDCTRSTWTDVSDNGAAYNAWNTACNALKSQIPPKPCPAAPANPSYTRTCSFTENSTHCDGNADHSSPCTSFGGWSGGTPYADSSGIYDTYPTAVAVGVPLSRSMNCGFVDTSPKCAAPDTDFNGTAWGKKNPKWYGGVQISSVTCIFDASQGGTETVNAY